MCYQGGIGSREVRADIDRVDSDQSQLCGTGGNCSYQRYLQKVPQQI